MAKDRDLVSVYRNKAGQYVAVSSFGISAEGDTETEARRNLRIKKAEEMGECENVFADPRRTDRRMHQWESDYLDLEEW